MTENKKKHCKNNTLLTVTLDHRDFVSVQFATGIMASGNMYLKNATFETCCRGLNGDTPLHPRVGILHRRWKTDSLNH